MKTSSPTARHATDATTSITGLRTSDDSGLVATRTPNRAWRGHW